MPYICLGYVDEPQGEAMSDSERNALMDACVAYDDVLRKHGYFVGGEALQSAQSATTLRYQTARCLSPMTPMLRPQSRWVAS